MYDINLASCLCGIFAESLISSICLGWHVPLVQFPYQGLSGGGVWMRRTRSSARKVYEPETWQIAIHCVSQAVLIDRNNHWR